MAHLLPRDFDRLLSGVAELYGCRSADEFPTLAMAVCSRLIPSELTGYTEIDPRHDGYVNVLDSPEAERVVDRLAPVWLRHYQSHPVLQYHRASAAPEVRAIADFLPLDKWRRTPLYNDFFRHLDVLHQMVIPLPRRGGLEIGVVLNRSRRRFTGRDRLFGTLLQEHLFRAHRNVAEVDELRRRIARWERGIAAAGMELVWVDERGRVTDRMAGPVSLLTRQFGRSRELPPEVQAWVRRQVQRLRARDEPLAPPEPWIIRCENTNLMLTLHRAGGTSQFLLAIREQSRRIDPRAFYHLGLTPREAEVLCCVALGLTNADAGARLGIRPRTVQKHLERVFVKLNVATRTEAALRAARELGFQP